MHLQYRGHKKVIRKFSINLQVPHAREPDELDRHLQQARPYTLSNVDEDDMT